MDVTQLDGVSLIVGALAAGAGDGLGEVAKNGVGRVAHSVGQGLEAARDRLVNLLSARFRNNEDASADLNVYVRRPTAENAESLRDHLIHDKLHVDDDILTAAREVLDGAGPTATGPGSVVANILSQINKDGGTGFIGGVHTHNHGERLPGGERLTVHHRMEDRE